MSKINDDDLNNVSGGIKVEANISNNDSEISENTSDNNVSDKNLILGSSPFDLNNTKRFKAKYSKKF